MVGTCSAGFSVGKDYLDPQEQRLQMTAAVMRLARVPFSFPIWDKNLSEELPLGAELLWTEDWGMRIRCFIFFLCGHPQFLSSARFLLLLCYSPELPQNYFLQLGVVH